MICLVIIAAGVANRIAPSNQIPILKGRSAIAVGRISEPSTSAMESAYGKNAETLHFIDKNYLTRHSL